MVSVPLRGDQFLNWVISYRASHTFGILVSVPLRGDQFLNKVTGAYKKEKYQGFRPLTGRSILKQ